MAGAWEAFPHGGRPVCALPVPAGALREGENLLAIVPPRKTTTIVLREIQNSILDRSIKPWHEATLP